VVMENLACSSGFKRFLKSSKTCLKPSSMLVMVLAPWAAHENLMGGLRPQLSLRTIANDGHSTES